MTRVLFVAESVSLAQVVRLRQLAAALPAAQYEVVFAASEFAPLIFRGTRFARRTIASMSSARMYRRIRRGARLYDTGTLARYVREELALLEEVEPALVVGDLRLSLAVSAPKLGVPYAALINAYWSPHARRESFPMPDHPVIDLLGVERVAPRFHKALPLVFDHFARPVNTLRRRYGLPKIGSLLEVLTYGDSVLHPDVPELTPVSGSPAHHHFLGPVLWAPRTPGVAASRLWKRRTQRPLVYVTLGSSGGLHVIDAVLRGLSELPVHVVLATAGRFAPRALPDNVRATDYVPGDQVTRRARLVICNGGSSTAYQALHAGTPVMGLPFNLDQYLAMDAIERAGAGLSLRSGAASAQVVRAAAERLLSQGAYRERARQLSHALRALDARRRFRSFVAAATGAARRP